MKIFITKFLTKNLNDPGQDLKDPQGSSEFLPGSLRILPGA